jgi:hypothetical protein
MVGPASNPDGFWGSQSGQNRIQSGLGCERLVLFMATDPGHWQLTVADKQSPLNPAVAVTVSSRQGALLGLRVLFIGLAKILLTLNAQANAEFSSQPPPTYPKA